MFTIDATAGDARTGRLTTAHGILETPCFLPVATKGTPKFLTSDMLRQMGINGMIANAFLLALKPGLDVIEAHGGLHKMMDFQGVLFNDCGGFQMLREGFSPKTSARGIFFSDPYSGDKVEMTPERLAIIYEKLKPDVAMTLDDVVPYGAPKERYAEALKKTHAWAAEGVRLKSNHGRLLFGIFQGGTFPDLRVESAKAISSLDVDGIAIGGLCIGEPKEKMEEAVRVSIPHCPADKPRYLMGVGSPLDIVRCVKMGVDVFDSIYPTSLARHGTIFSWEGKLDMTKSSWNNDHAPLVAGCGCVACTKHTRSYISHLTRMHEPTGYILRTIHNVWFMNELMKEVRLAIKEKRLEDTEERLKGWKK